MSNVQKFKRPELSSEVLFWIDHNLVNYLETSPENYTEIEHIIDYLNSDQAPTRLKKMSYEEAKTGSDRWTKALQKRGNNIVETEADLKTIIDFQDGFKLVQLLTKSSYEREGFLMSHCVGSYFNKSETKIYSLRDYQNVPHCTMEVTGSDSIQQIKGKGNGSIHPKYIKYVVQSLQKFGMSVNSNELENLGYIELSDIVMKELEKQFKDKVKFMNFGGKKYLYVYSKLE